MDAKNLINAMIAEYATYTLAPDGSDLLHHKGWSEALVWMTMLTYGYDRTTAEEYVGEQVADVRANMA